ncbi:VCBS repeat-containing protein [Candidatus Woesearchaeota archaeon]|nr:VCBS repeat-containing protein [Candidatus Woesearchaeota archaeon]
MAKEKKGRTINPVVIVIIVMSLFVSISHPSSAIDFRSSVQPPQLTTESGVKLPGQASTDLFTGSVTYQYPIEVPPGVNGLEPTVSLNYNHQQTSSLPTPVGYAWDITRYYVSRSIEFTRQNTGDDTFILHFGGADYPLVYVASEGRYHTKTESFFNIQKKTGAPNNQSEYWEAKMKDGTSYRFGYNQDSELMSNLEPYAVQWHLDTVADTHGNKIVYSYTEDNGTAYQNRIAYGNTSILFQYAPGNFSRRLFVQGNEIRQSKVLQNISVQHNASLVRRYELNYTLNNPMILLSKIKMVGNDGRSELPPATFDYYLPNVSFENSPGLALPEVFGRNEDEGTRLIDVDNDGLQDVIQLPESGTMYYYRNTGNGWAWMGSTSGFMSTGAVDSDGNDLGVRFFDANGDGKMDILKLVEGDINERSLYLNNGNGWTSSSASGIPAETFTKYDTDVVEPSCRDTDYPFFKDFSCDEARGRCTIECYVYQCRYDFGGDLAGYCGPNAGCCSRYDYYDYEYDEYNRAIPVRKEDEDSYYFYEFVVSNDLGVRTVDVNGDGKTDILVSAGASRAAYINTGSSYISDTTWLAPVAFVDSSKYSQGVQFADVNNDGLIDIIRGKSPTAVYLNTGAGWTADSSWSPYFFIIDFVHQPVTLADMNADGFVDMVWLNNTIKGILYNKGNRWESGNAGPLPAATLVNFSTEVIDINGDGSSDVVIAPSTSSKFTYLNTAKNAYLLQSIRNGLGGSINFSYTPSTRFVNTGNDSMSDLALPFAAVTSVLYDNGMSGEHQTRFTIMYNYSGGLYDAGDHEFRGFSFVQETEPDGGIIKHFFHQDGRRKGMEYKTELYNGTKLYTRVEYAWNGTTKDGYSIVLLDQQQEQHYDGIESAPPMVIETRYGYDEYGNPTKISSLGDTSLSADNRHDYVEYAYNLPSWIVDKVKRAYLRDSADSAMIKETRYSYDSLAYAAPPAKGDITMIERWNNGSANTNEYFTYDRYGNAVSFKNSNGIVTNYSYDPTNVFAAQERNALGQSVYSRFDPGTGNPLSKTDANGAVTSYEYDVFGRTIKEIRPYDSTPLPTKEYSYSLSGTAPSGVLQREREVSGTSSVLATSFFYDGFGKAVQTRTEAEDEMERVGNFFYNSNGLIRKQLNMVTQPISGMYTPASSYELAYDTIFSYSPAGELIEQRNPDETVKKRIQNRSVVTVLDENGNKEEYTLDGHKNIITIREYNNGSVYTTRYSYDATGNLISIIDHGGNNITYTYDGLGRKKTMADPDVGAWRYEYDAAGNLANQTDAKGTVILFTYDPLNRVTMKRAANETVEYAYDAGRNGTLSSVKTPQLTTSYSYDNRLRQTSKTYQYDDGTIATVAYSYDALDRVTKEAYPTKNVTYLYGDGGLIKNISGFLDWVTYTGEGSVNGRYYQNGLASAMMHDPATNRMTRLVTGNPEWEEQGDYQYDTYSYDPVGNVNSITDSVSNRIKTMRYDGLHRLTHAEEKIGTVPATPVYSYDYTYDYSGNMLRIQSPQQTIKYIYDAAGPLHAPSRVEVS